MILIDTWEKFKQLAKDLPNDKVISRFYVTGYLHEGHHKLIEKVKSNCDILIVQFNELFRYFEAILKFPYKYDLSVDYQEIISSTENDTNIDYLVLMKLPEKEKLDSITSKVKKDYEIVKKECDKLNISEVIAIEVMFIHTAKDPIRHKISDKIGPKFMVQVLLHKKIFPHMYKDINFSLDTDAIFKFYKSQSGDVITRSKVPTLVDLRKDAIELLQKGEKSGTILGSLINSYFLFGKKFTILDLNTVEKLKDASDNCIIIYMDAYSYELIIIKDGVVIF